MRIKLFESFNRKNFTSSYDEIKDFFYHVGDLGLVISNAWVGNNWKIKANQNFTSVVNNLEQVNNVLTVRLSNRNFVWSENLQNELSSSIGHFEDTFNYKLINIKLGAPTPIWIRDISWFEFALKVDNYPTDLFLYIDMIFEKN